MVQGWVLHLSLVTVFIRSILEIFLSQNHKLKNLLASVEKLVIISKFLTD